MEADDFREKAQRCRLLVTTALRPDVKQQLRLWSSELEDLADAIEAEDMKGQSKTEGASFKNC